MSETTIQIEKNIPMPKRSSVPPLPLKQMEVGDSFELALEGERDKATIRQRLTRFQTSHKPIRLSMQQIDENRVRIFRLEDHK